jgi:hypothetical protein
MFPDLYDIAKKNDLDLVKADFYKFKTNNGTKEKTVMPLDKTGTHYNVVFDPSHTPEAVYFTLNTWTGIYKRDFIEKCHIRHNETPGASFQDNGFFFQTFIYGQRAMIIDTPYYLKRIDNPNSSVYNRDKVYTMSIEMDWVMDILKRDPEIWERFKYMYWWRKFQNYMFRYNVLDKSFKQEFMNRFCMEFKWAKLRGELDFNVFEPSQRATLEEMITLADKYYFRHNLSVSWKIKKLIPKTIKDFLKKLLWGKEYGNKKS